MTTYLLAGGGTAGHVNPMLATADALRARHPAAQIIVLGTASGLEAELVPARGYELVTIPKVPFPRRPNRAALTFPAELSRTVRQVRSLISTRGVDVVVGFGGYAAAPAYLAARREQVPFVVHEANARPGLANRLGARRAAAVGVAFPGTSLAGAQVVGMPLRPEIASLANARAASADGPIVAEARERLGLTTSPVLLITGGSLGARVINQVFTASAQVLADAGWQVLHIAGARNDAFDPEVPGYHFIEYSHRMEDALAVADVAVSRAGASTVSELSALGIPAIYAPYPHGNGEQELNARPAVEAGAALLVQDSDLSAEWITETLLPLLHDDARVAAVRQAARGFGIVDAADRFVDIIDSVEA